MPATLSLYPPHLLKPDLPTPNNWHIYYSEHHHNCMHIFIQRMWMFGATCSDQKQRQAVYRQRTWTYTPPGYYIWEKGEREGIAVYKRTSHPPNIQTWPILVCWRIISNDLEYSNLGLSYLEWLSYFEHTHFLCSFSNPLSTHQSYTIVWLR